MRQLTEEWIAKAEAQEAFMKCGGVRQVIRGALAI